MPDVQDGHLQYVMATLLLQRLQFTAPALSQDLGVLTLVLSVYWGAHTWDVKAKMLCSRLFAPRPAAGGVAKLVPEATGTP